MHKNLKKHISQFSILHKIWPSQLPAFLQTWLPKKLVLRLKFHKTSSKKKSLKQSIFTTIASSALLLIFISIIYFFTLISIEYKSIPFITDKIEKIINNHLSGDNVVKIAQASLKFSQMHKIKIKFDNIRLISGNKKEFLLPKIEAEFSIFNLVLLKIIPSKIKIINPEIEIDQTNESQIRNIGIKQINDQGSEMLWQQNYLRSLSQIFSLLKNGKVPIKDFYIINAKINVNNQNNLQIITLKESQISTSFNNGYLHLSLQNKINFDPSSPDLTINADCQFKEDQGLKCDANFKNFAPESIISLDSSLLPLQKIKGNFDGNINFLIDQNQLSSVSFDILSKSGEFYHPQYFKNQINFQNLSASGKFDNSLKTFSLNDLKCNFDDTQFNMSLLMNDFFDANNQKMIVHFKIKNVQTDELENFWPLFLNHNNVRGWVLNHINAGVIKEGYATMVLGKKDGVDYLQKIESELIFSGLNLQYNKNFPPITKVDGIASFSQKQMKIDISKGEVLESKINSASVAIKDFDAQKIMLEINGEVSGAAEDSLKHISYKSDFAASLSNYFGGKATTTLEIKLPITSSLKLSDTYIKVVSDIQNFNNNNIGINSNITISTVKEFANNHFRTEANLTNATINLKQFNINKKYGLVSKIKTDLSFDGSNLYLKNFDWQQEKSSLRGNLSLQTNPNFKVIEVNLKNHNFANGNFDLSYKIAPNLRFLRLKGKLLDLKTILAGNATNDNGFSGLEHYQKNDIKFSLGTVLLAGEQIFKDVNVDINCDGPMCKNGFIKTKLNAKQNIDIEIFKPTNVKSQSQIIGSIGDVSLVAKAFNLSNQIIDGYANIKAELGDDGQLKGEIKIDSGFAILKNQVVEKIYKNDAFVNLKDKISNDNKIEFDNLKLLFFFKNNIVDIDTLIANSYMMGFTAKGKIDFVENSIILKGLIVPGYALNKLFGVGGVPILGKIIVGEEGGGIFAVRYDYIKNKNNKEGDFSINPASVLIPGGIRNIFNLF